MIRHVLRLHWTKRPHPDVKRDKNMRKLAQNFRREMQAGRWRRERAGRVGKHRLISRFILGVALPPDVRR